MNRINLFVTITILTALLPILAQDKTKRIAIIKADDVRGISPKWDRFFKISKEKGIKVSAGIICNSLQKNKKGYFKWLNKLQDSGLVEFWNHGFDHKRWKKDGTNQSEFGGSGYKHQKKHFNDAQKLMKKVLGIVPVAFGTPYNAVDADTMKIMSEDPKMRLFFCYNVKGLDNKILAPMKLRGESDGTGKPNFKKFKSKYNKSISFTAIQFHPGGFSDKHFSEYAKIIDFLIAEGWVFMLPTEYVTMMDKTKKENKKKHK